MIFVVFMWTQRPLDLILAPPFKNKQPSPDQTLCSVLGWRDDDAALRHFVVKTALTRIIIPNERPRCRRRCLFCLLFWNEIFHCVFIALNWPSLLFLRRLGVEIGKAQVYQEANRGTISLVVVCHWLSFAIVVCFFKDVATRDYGMEK